MKKIFFVIVSLIALSVSASAINLKEAFEALSNVPNINTRMPDANIPVVCDFVADGQIAAAYNLDPAKISETGTAVLTILNQIPMSYIINGGTNGQVTAFVYATPNDSGENDILVVSMSRYKRAAVSLFGTASDETVEAIRNAPLEIQGNYLDISAQEGSAEFNVKWNKAR